MLFVILAKFKKKPTKESIAENRKLSEKEAKEEGIKDVAVYWTLGKYDAVVVLEAPNVKAAMKAMIRRREFLSTETLVALPAEEARKLVE
ncbi:MAG TPA: GYD domain-containing protein [Candidatus Bathyarchaeia archaeon]|nr:GYD domain-containing protein [Candidatus Bathyarchaeia archaeon]